MTQKDQETVEKQLHPMTESHADILCHTDTQKYQDVQLQAQVDMCLHLPSPSVELFPAKQHHVFYYQSVFTQVAVLETSIQHSPSPPTDNYLSYDDCLEDKRKDYQNCSMQYCKP